MMNWDSCVLWLEKAMQAPKWIDVSKHGNNGIMTGARFKEAAIAFDGVDDGVNCGNHSSLNNSPNMTLECLIKPYTLSHHPYGNSTHHCMIGKYQTDGEQRSYALTTGYFWAGGLSFVVSSTGDNFRMQGWNVGMQVNTWYHVVLTYRAGVTKMYLDGEDLGTADTITGIYTTTIFASTAAVCIGSIEKFANSGCWFDGKIALARVYNAALTAQQVKEAYQQCYRRR